MGCFVVLLGAFFPRVALVLVWLFTNYVERAFDMFLIPLIGLIFLPYTTLAYVLVYSPAGGIQGFDWFWLVLGLVLDIGSYGSGRRARRHHD
jgi:hypothetical protein